MIRRGGEVRERRHTVEHSTTSQIHVHHPMLCPISTPRVFNILSEAQVGDDTVDSAQFTIFDHFPDLDA